MPGCLLFPAIYAFAACSTQYHPYMLEILFRSGVTRSQRGLHSRAQGIA